MPPKAAEKKPTTAGKAPAGKAPAAEKKEAGKKTAAAPSGEKKKRGKTRKETYSSYIYKGKPIPAQLRVAASVSRQFVFIHLDRIKANASFSPQASPPRYRYLQPCYVHPELIRQRYVTQSLSA